MSAITLFCDPFAYIVDINGKPLVGAKITTFAAGTSTPLAVYHDPDLAVPWTQPIVTNSAGQSTDQIYMSPTPAALIVVVDANDVPVPGWPVDAISPAAVAV